MAAKSKKAKIVPIFVEDDEDDGEDCPRCPPVGAPAWMATFADVATLLMAFFVLIIAFANFDEVSFKKMTGALREHFGTKVLDVLPHPESATIIPMDFRPASAPPSPHDTPANEDHSAAQSEILEEIAEILAQAVAQGEMTLSNTDGLVSVRLPEGAALEDLAQALTRTVDEFAQISDQGATDQATGQPDDQAGAGTDPQQEAEQGDAGSNTEARAAIADARLRVALRELQDQGLVDVQQDEERVIVTVGAGGAFRSGSADLTQEAQEIMARIAQTGVGQDARVTVSGHTDSVPLSGGPFTDNWGLAAARASSVVRELGASGLVDPASLTAVSRGETVPVASNDTDAGREANRRIEIEFDYGSGGRGG